MIFPYLTVFNKIGVDGLASITPGLPLQVIHIRLVSLRWADDDGCLWGRTVAAPISWQVNRISFVFSEETLVALVALYRVE